MEKLVETLGITRLSKSQVSVMATELDEHVESFRTRPMDAGPYTFIVADALVLKARQGGRVVNVHARLATGVNAAGHREILGLDVTFGEDGAGWLGSFRGLVARAPRFGLQRADSTVRYVSASTGRGGQTRQHRMSVNGRARTQDHGTARGYGQRGCTFASCRAHSR